MKQVFITLVCIILIIMQGCKKGDASTNTVAQISLLTSGTWKLTMLEFENLNGTWTTVAIPSVQANEAVSFNTDNTYTSVVGSSSAHGTWQFSPDYKQLTIVNQINNQTQTPLVSVLTSTTLQLLSYVSQTVNGISYYAERDTFGH